MSAAYPLTVIEENGARAGPTGFVENVHAMIRVVAEDPGLREVELTVVLTRDIAARPGRSPHALAESECCQSKLVLPRPQRYGQPGFPFFRREGVPHALPVQLSSWV
ncbi:hypothetical protein AB0B52_28905 [Streptomyces griseofuscus]|uniref:hypothetical protein n=1 Tax=Streptomyces griseofuscus TaxID=146922 RepID=UPI00340CA6D1